MDIFLTFAVLIHLLDVFVCGLELLNQLRVFGLEEFSLPGVGGLGVVETLLVLQHQRLPGPGLLGPGAEQPDDLSVGNIRRLLLLPRGCQFIKNNPTVDGESPKMRNF